MFYDTTVWYSREIIGKFNTVGTNKIYDFTEVID